MDTELIKSLLQASIDDYNALIEREEQQRTAMAATRDQRLSAFGRMQALDDLLKIALRDESMSMSADDGSGDNEPAKIVQFPSDNPEHSS